MIAIRPSDGITVGKEYSILEVNKNGDYIVKNDNGKIFNYNPRIFINGIQLNITPKYYDNSKGSLYQFAENQNLNAYEFDIIKRIIRCRKKGLFREDLEKTKFLIDLYLKEYEEN